MIYNLPNIIPTNTHYTHELLVTLLRSALADYGGQQIDTTEIRMWLNLGLTRAAALIRTFAPQLYTVRWQASLQNEEYLGFDVAYGTVQAPYKIIDLAEPVQTVPANYLKGEITWPERILPIGVDGLISPYKYISNIVSLQIIHKYPTSLATYWHGLPQKLDIDTFTGVSTGLNDQWRQDIVWTMQGHKVMVWFGKEVLQNPSLGNQAITTNWYADSLVELTVLRKPILDDLKSLDNTNITSNYTEYVDCPDEAISLVLQYAREIALGVMGKAEDAVAKQTTAMLEQSFLTSLGHAPQAPAQ